MPHVIQCLFCSAVYYTCLAFKSKKLAYGVVQSKVEVHEKAVTLFVEVCEVVGIVVEERALSVCTYNSVPMLVSPVAVLTDTNVAHGNAAAVMYNGYGKALLAVLRCYYGTAPVCLLDIRRAGIEEYCTAVVQLYVQRQRGKV